MECYVQSGIPQFSSMGTTIIPDDGVIENTCDRGHLTYSVIENPKYELLAEIAVMALVDGYYREAVANFASALERLFEDFVILSCRIRHCGENEFNATWKQFARQSERQYGAFAICYLLEDGREFQNLPRKQIKFRNNVIHNGTIPSRADAIKYGQAVIDCSRPITDLLNSERFDRHRIDLLIERSKRRREKLKGFRISSQAMSSPLGFDVNVTRFDLAAMVEKRERGPKTEQMTNIAKTMAPFLDLALRISKPELR